MSNLNNTSGVIKPTGQNASGLNFWTVVDYNGDGVVNDKDLEAIIARGLKSGAGYDPQELSGLLGTLKSIVGSYINGATVTEKPLSADGKYFFSVEVKNPNFKLSDFVAGSESGSIGKDLKNNINPNDPQTNPTFSNPIFNFTISPNSKPTMAITLNGIQFSAITSLLAVATNQFTDAIGVTAPGLIDALKNVPNSTLINLIIDARSENFAIEFDDPNSLPGYQIDVEKFINTLNKTGFPALPTDKAIQALNTTLNGFSKIKVDKPKIYFAKSDKTTGFNISVKVNDDILTLKYEGNVKYEKDKKVANEVIYKVEYKDGNTIELPLSSILDLPGGLTIKNPTYTISSGNTKFDEEGKEPKYVKGFNWTGTIEIDNPMPKEITNFLDKYVGFNLDKLFDSQLLAGVGFGTDGAKNLNLYLDLELDKPVVKFPYQIPNFDESFELYFNGFGLDYSLTPINMGFTTTQALSGNITLQGYDPVQKNEPGLNLVGGFKTIVSSDPTKNGVLGYFNLDTLGSGWRNPFGIPNSEFRQLALEIGFGPTALKSIGFIGDLRFGNYDFDAFISLDINDPQKNGFGLTLNRPISAMDLFLGPVGSFTAGQLSNTFDEVENVFDLLNSIFDLTLESIDGDGDGDLDPLFYFMPQATSIAGQPFDQGTHINAGISAWGWDGRLSYSATTSLFGYPIQKGSLSLEKIDIGGLGWFVLEGIDDPKTTTVDESKELNLDFSNTGLSLSADASLTLFGLNVAKASVEVGLGGIDIDAKLNLFNTLGIDAKLFVGNLKEGQSAQVTVNADGTVSLAEGVNNQGFLSLAGQPRTYLSLDGINDYVQATPTGLNLANQDFTIEAWIKTTGTKESILVKSDGDTIWEKGEKAFYINELGKVNFVGFGNNYIKGNTAVNDGKWHHVAVVWDYSSGTTGTGRVFVDGVNDTQSSNYAATNLDNSTDTLKIGSLNFSEATNYFSGQIDEVRIWKTARTESEIKTNSDNRVNPATETNLVYYLPVDQGDRATITTTTVNSDPLPRKEILTLEGETEQTALIFDGVNDYVQVKAGDASFADFNTSNFTVELWVKTTDLNGTLIGASNTSTGTGDYWRVWLENGQTKFNFQPGGNTQPSASSINAINDDSWHHIAVVRDGFYTGKLYVDGVLDSKLNFTGSSNGIDINSDLFIGQWVSGTDQFAGKMDEVRIWKTARTETEISANMNQRLDKTVETNLTYYLPIDQSDRSIRENKILSETFDGGLPKSIYNVSLTDNNIASVSDKYRQITPTLSTPNAIAHWRLNESSGTTATNIGTLGTTVNGTYVGSPTLNNPGLVAGSTGVKFDGVNDGIAIPDHNNINLLATTARSIELWFKADDLTGKQVIYEEGGTGSGLNIYLDGDQLKLGAWSGNAGEWLATQVVKDNKYHVVLSFDQGNLTGYLNGESFGTVTTSFTSIPVHSEDIGIGYMKQDTRLSDTVRLTGDGNYFNGVIDEVALYNVGLSPERAIANYASGFTQGLKVETFNNINLAGDPVTIDLTNSFQNLTVASNSSQKITGWIQAPVTGTYTFNTTNNYGTRLAVNDTKLIDNWQNPEKAIDFDGIGDYIQIENYDGMYDRSKSMTVEAWIKVDQFNTASQAIIRKGDNGWRLERNGTTNKIDFTFDVYKNTTTTQVLDGNRSVVSNRQFNDQQWHHVIATTDGLNVTLYVDGKLDNSVTYTNPNDGYSRSIFNSNAPVIIGGYRGTTQQYFDGKIDEVAIWNKYFTATDAQTNFTQKLTGSEANLVGYWNFDHPQGLKTIVDQSSNHNNGYFRGVVSPDQSQVNSWSSKLVAYKNDYSSVFTPTTQSGTNTIDLVAGKLYKVELDAQSLNGVSTPQLQWNYTGVSNQIIPTSALFTDAQVETDWKVSGGKIGTSFLNTDADGALEFFNTTGDRYAISQPYDLSQGGNLSFSLILGGNSTINNISGGQVSVANGSTNGDTVDDNKAIKLEYSIDNGNTWVLLDSFTSKSEGGNWHNVVIDLPKQAQTQSTRFKWSQPSYVLDNWAIDNVGVVTNSNNVWADIKGADVLKAQRDNGITISNGEALYFTGKPFAIVTPLPDVSQPLLKDSFANLITGDFNGDGKTDFLRQQKFQWSYDNQLVTTYLSQGDGTFNTVNTNYPSPVANDFSAIIQTGDFNGDRKTDFIRQNKDSGGSNFQVVLSNGDGTFNAINPSGNAGSTTYNYQTSLLSNPGVNLIMGDYNGDRKTDFIRQEKSGWDNDNDSTFSVWLSNGNGTFNPMTPSGDVYQKDLKFDGGANIITGDFNGDGKTDFIRQEKNGYDDDKNNTFNVYFSNGNGTFNPITPSGDVYQDDLRFDPGANIITGDFNGDGKTDFIRQEKGDRDNDIKNTFNVYFSNGNGTFNIVTPGSNVSGDPYQDKLRSDPGVNIITGDYNGDGKTDFIRQEKGDWDNDISDNFSIYLSQGNGYFNIVSPNLPEYQSVLNYDKGANIIVGDYNGDGAGDFLRQERGTWGDDYANTYQTYLSKLNQTNQRYATTQSLNTTDTKALQFDFVFGQKYTAGNPFTYEGSTYGDEDVISTTGDAPEAGEDVLVSYSTNGGQTWTTLTTLLASNYATTYTNWTTQAIALPDAAKTDHTQFRWQQTNFTNTGDDTWAIDNITLASNTIMSGVQFYTPITQVDNFKTVNSTNPNSGNSNSKFVIMGNGNISFLGETISSVSLDVSENGLKFNLFDTFAYVLLDNGLTATMPVKTAISSGAYIIGTLSKDISVIAGKNGASVTGALGLEFPLSLSVPYFGTLKLASLKADGVLNLTVGTDGKISGYIKDIDFTVWGKNLSIPSFSFSSNVNSWDDLIVETSQAVADKIQKEFLNLFDDAEQLYNGIKNGTIDFAKDVESFFANYGQTGINALKDLGSNAASLYTDVGIGDSYNTFNKSLQNIANAVGSGISGGVKKAGKTLKKAFNGPIADAKVFLDINGNFIPDQNEPTVTTDNYGRFNLQYNLNDYDTNGDGKLDYTEALVIGMGGIDTTTGKEVKVPFMATVGSEISPLTTLKTGLMLQGLTETAAETIIKQSFDLDKFGGILLNQFDAYSEIGQGHLVGYDVAIAQTMAHNLLLLGSAVIKQIQPQLSDSEVQNQLFKIIAQVVADQGTIDPTNPGVNRSLINALTQNSPTPVSDEIVSAFSSLMIETESQLHKIVGDTSHPDNLRLILPTLNYMKTILVENLPVIMQKVITKEIEPADVMDSFHAILNQNNHLIQYGLNEARTVTISTEGILKEGDSSFHHGKFIVNLGETAPAQGLTIFYTLSGTATLGEDYQLLYNPTVGQLNIAPYEKTGIIDLEVLDDTLSESPESITLTLQYAGDGFAINPNQNTAYFVIKDDENSGNNSVFRPDQVIAGTINNDILTGTDQSEWLKGSYGNDQIFGLGNNDKIDGGFGNDILHGGSGDDIMAGQFGADQLWGEDGNDLLQGGTGNDILNGGAGSDVINGGEGDDQLTGDAGNDQLEGDAGNDLINGNADNDWLSGGIGNDILIGGAGDDVVSGGIGADQFVITSGNDGFDIFSDFNPAEGDRIVIDSKQFDSFDLSKLTFAHGFLKYDGQNLALIQNQGNIYALLNLKPVVDVVSELTFPTVFPANSNILTTGDIPSLATLTHTTVDPTQSEGLLGKILTRGYIKVAIAPNTPQWQKEQAKALAAALFGDSQALQYVTLDEKDIFAAVATQQVDISAHLFPNTYENQIDFAPATFYDSEVIVVKNNSHITQAQDLQNVTIGVIANSDSRQNLRAVLGNAGINYKLAEFADNQTLRLAYDNNQIGAVVLNPSQVKDLPTGNSVLDLELSTQAMSMVLPENESSWADVVRWAITAPIAAESLGITSTNLDSLVNSNDPAIRRFLGLEGNLGQSLGISNDFANQVIRTMGNYAEFWQNNFGDLSRSRNHLFADDGLLYSLPFAGSVSQKPELINNNDRNVLTEIKARGFINAGVSSSQYPGLFYQENDQWSGFHIDILKALSVALFGDANHLNFSNPTSFLLSSLTNTANGVVDISSNSTTHNLVRDGSVGIDFSKPYFFDGQAILVGLDSGISSLGTLTGRRIGVEANTTAFAGLDDNLVGINFTKVEYTSTTNLYNAYQNGEIDALIGDRSIIASRLSTFSNPENHKILDQVLSREPIAFVVDENQSDWLDVINLIIDTLTKAEELGITSANVDQLVKGNNPAIREFLGVNGKLGEKFGLTANFAQNIIKSMGNYGEIYQRNLGAISIPRDANQSFADFGLQSANSYTSALSIANPELEIRGNGIFQVMDNLANIKFNLLKHDGRTQAEIGLYKTDADGSINGINRNSTGYLSEVLKHSQTIFSILDNNPNGFDSNSFSRTLGEFDNNTYFGLYMIQGRDATTVLNTGDYSSLVLSQNVKALQTLDNGANLVFNWETNGDNSYDDLIIEAAPTLEGTVFGTTLDKTIDLTGLDHQVHNISFTVNREAAYDNLIGFYRVNEQGQVLDSQGKVVSGNPNQDSNYAQLAINNRLDILLSTGNQQTAVFNEQLMGGVRYAPILIANGGSASSPNFSHTYFAYSGANSDGVNHVRRMADNIFGFEDIRGGGDNDFNDVIVSVKVI
ncbi:transporter substrate-binding domain-containing protein [Dolichospermum sp. LEGE 00240]|uniref:LamG-like jellyroll fold domain-containing protein n=1 Tax=Dolichospermum sp. LEGE 00240 TaxID=1828603 RepID=UPI0018812F5C|nr:LamG-like jellyroll fold domain-containing protein [Dolichospermum sp. LEGE 00240]MBE9248627.1 transporter substrate-binding domain-containing protein [Dolichospermum sp. LEGE 00240]